MKPITQGTQSLSKRSSYLSVSCGLLVAFTSSEHGSYNIFRVLSAAPSVCICAQVRPDCAARALHEERTMYSQLCCQRHLGRRDSDCERAEGRWTARQHACTIHSAPLFLRRGTGHHADTGNRSRMQLATTTAGRKTSLARPEWPSPV